MRQHIMNIDPASKYSLDHRSVLEHDDVAAGTKDKLTYLTALLKNNDQGAETLIGWNKIQQEYSLYYLLAWSTYRSHT